MKTKKIIPIKNSLFAIWTAVTVVQLGFAIMWAVNNFNNVQEFYDTSIYVDNLVARVADGWHLPGYSVLMLLFRKLFGFVKQNYETGLYGFQILFSLFCFTESVRSVILVYYKKSLPYKYAIWAGLYILTIPMIWQMQFAVLPDAMCLAATVILFAKLLEFCREDMAFRWDCLYVIAGSLLLTGTFQRYYFYGCVLLVILFCCFAVLQKLKKQEKTVRKWKTIFFVPLILVLAVLISVLYPKTVGTSATYPEYRVETDLFQRTVLPYLSEASKYYDEELKTQVTPELVETYGKSKKDFYTILIPHIEREYGAVQSRVIYDKMQEKSFTIYIKDIVKDFLKELVGYVCAPFSFVKYVYNTGNTLFSYNITRMLSDTPELSIRFMIFGTNGFCLLSIMALLLVLIKNILCKPSLKEMLSKTVMNLLALLVVTIPQMLFATNRMDYRIGLFALVIWSINILVLLMEGFALKEDKNG